MAKITYTNKSNVNTLNNIPAENKVSDTDMNEIKSVVNGNYDEMLDELYYKATDIVEIGGATAATEYISNGYISSGSQSLFISITTPKKLDNISSITFNSILVEGRSIDGYLNNQSGFNEYVGISGYTIVANKAGSNAITVRINKSSAFTKSGGGSITNNTPIELNGYFKFTLS